MYSLRNITSLIHEVDITARASGAAGRGAGFDLIRIAVKSRHLNALVRSHASMSALPNEIRCLKDDVKWQTWPTVIFLMEQTLFKTSHRQG